MHFPGAPGMPCGGGFTGSRLWVMRVLAELPGSTLEALTRASATCGEYKGCRGRVEALAELMKTSTNGNEHMHFAVAVECPRMQKIAMLSWALTASSPDCDQLRRVTGSTRCTLQGCAQCPVVVNHGEPDFSLCPCLPVLFS